MIIFPWFLLSRLFYEFGTKTKNLYYIRPFHDFITDIQILLPLNKKYYWGTLTTYCINLNEVTDKKIFKNALYQNTEQKIYQENILNTFFLRK